MRVPGSYPVSVIPRKNDIASVNLGGFVRDIRGNKLFIMKLKKSERERERGMLIFLYVT